jgi:hypothetical protein
MCAQQSLPGTRQSPDSWTWRDGGEAIRMPDWVRDDQDTRDRACGHRSPDLLVGCTRPPGHPGRHIATGVLDMLAAWPGVHVPVRADLGHPAVTVEEGTKPAPPILPDGWEVSQAMDSYIAEAGKDLGLDGVFVYASRKGVGDGAGEIEPEQARALAARMVEAADIVDQIRNGAR